NADSQKGNALLHYQAALLGDKADPMRAVFAAVTRFGEHNGLLIAVVHFFQQGAERSPARILVFVGPWKEMTFLTVKFPLVVVIVVEADYIEQLRATTQLGAHTAQQDICNLI